VYSEYSTAVEAWHAKNLVPPCKISPTLFCPDAPLTTGEFIESVVALSAGKQGPQKQDRSILRRDVTGKDDVPLTRVDAALILYNSQR
jgi:hypothetical protein